MVGHVISGIPEAEGRLEVTTEQRGTVEVSNLSNLLTILSEIPRDPRDALCEFISNGRDALIESGIVNGQVVVRLEHKKGGVSIEVSDDGIGMSRERLHHAAHHICDSEKVNRPNMIGHKGIGIISFLQLSDECNIVSRGRDCEDTYSLVLRKDLLPDYIVRLTSEKVRWMVGTDVYFPRIRKEIRRAVTRPKLHEHLRSRYRSALLRGEFSLKLYEDKKGGLVLPDQYKGEPFGKRQIRTRYGYIEMALYLWPSGTQTRRVALVGEGGVTICDDISELDEFDHHPWESNQIEGEIRFAPLRPSATRRGVVRDSRKFPVFVQAIQDIEPSLEQEIDRISKEHEERISRQVLTHLREIFSKILKELQDVESPVRVPFRTPLGQLSLGQVVDELDRVPAGHKRIKRGKRDGATSAVVDETKEGQVKRRYRPLPMVFPKDFEERKQHLRSELDLDQKVIYINSSHPDYKRERAEGIPSFLNYIVLVTTKEYVVWNNPGADQVTIGEDMIRYLVRARRHMPKRL